MMTELFLREKLKNTHKKLECDFFFATFAAQLRSSKCWMTKRRSIGAFEDPDVPKSGKFHYTSEWN